MDKKPWKAPQLDEITPDVLGAIETLTAALTKGDVLDMGKGIEAALQRLTQPKTKEGR